MVWGKDLRMPTNPTSLRRLCGGPPPWPRRQRRQRRGWNHRGAGGAVDASAPGNGDSEWTGAMHPRTSAVSRWWWFQIMFGIFTPKIVVSNMFGIYLPRKLGEDESNYDLCNIFSDGLVQPPTIGIDHWTKVQPQPRLRWGFWELGRRIMCCGW